MNSKQAKEFIKALDALVAEKGIELYLWRTLCRLRSAKDV